MLAILIIILVLLWAAVVWSIYSNFLVFHSNFSETENYHKAYYASISALERWELVTKQRQPWYIWSWGFILWTWQWWDPTYNDWGSDKSLSGFSYLWTNKDVSSVLRSINSRATRIPATWKWDVERMLSADDSNNYNMMDYEDAEIFLLYYDNGDGNPYDSGIINNSAPTLITWEIRLPQLLFNSWFWYLDTWTSSIWLSGSLPTNDAMVDRQIRWNYNDSPFTIFSTQSLIIWGPKPIVDTNKDSVFREDDINGNWNHGLLFTFEDKQSPIDRSPLASPTIISQEENNISGLNYGSLFGVASDTQLRFSLLNLLWTWRYVYPFLEYYVDFWWENVSDKYFTINGQWNFKDYQVNTVIQKPTAKESILWNFTSIF